MFAPARERTGNDSADPVAWPRTASPEHAGTPVTEARDSLKFHGKHGAGACLSLSGLIGDLGGRLVITEPSALDDVLVDGLRQIAELLQMDQAALWRRGESDDHAVASHCWIRHSQSDREPFQLTSVSSIAAKLEAGEPASVARVEDVAGADREAFCRGGVRAAAAVPVVFAGNAARVHGALSFSSTMMEREWTTATLEQLRILAAVFAQALAYKASLTALQLAADEANQLRKSMTEDDVPACTNVRIFRASQRRDHLRAENLYLRHEAEDRLGTGVIVGHSAAIHRVLEQARQVAATDSTVLLLGETGTGKELIATQLHEQSARRGRVMVRVNCSAIPNTLIESELFGREKGAFTGALARQIGRFEVADHSTIFLDEIGDLPADVQVKLLRVLEERQIERLGSPKSIRVDVRIIAATHRNLEKRIEEDAFREDLFYRLNVFPIHVPALRDRVEDIPLLVWRFVDEFSKAFGKRIEAIPRENMTALQQYAWPGNIRELRNVVERAMIVATGTQLTIPLPTPSAAAARRSVRMTDVEKDHIRSVLETSGWRIRGSGGAAERLGLPPTTLETRMAKLGICRPKRV